MRILTTSTNTTCVSTSPSRSASLSTSSSENVESSPLVSSAGDSGSSPPSNVNERTQIQIGPSSSHEKRKHEVSVSDQRLDKTYTEYYDDSLDPTSLLKKVERHFLRKEYRKSLFLVNNYFRSRQSDNYVQSTLLESRKGKVLIPSITINVPCGNFMIGKTECESLEHEFTFLVDFRGSPHCEETVNQLVCIGLQSWHEMSRTRIGKGHDNSHFPESEETQRTHKDRIADKYPPWSHLLHILGYFNITASQKNPEKKLLDLVDDTGYVAREKSFHLLDDETSSLKKGAPEQGAVSIELLSAIWIPFWEINGYEVEAFMWTIQALHYYHVESPHLKVPKTRFKNAACKHQEVDRDKENIIVVEELWARCVCQQIPKYAARDKNLTKRIFGIVSGVNRQSLGEEDFVRLYRELKQTIDVDGSSDDQNTSEYCALVNSFIDKIVNKNPEFENLTSRLADMRTTVTILSEPIPSDACNRSTRTMMSREILLKTQELLLKELKTKNIATVDNQGTQKLHQPSHCNSSQNNSDSAHHTMNVFDSGYSYLLSPLVPETMNNMHTISLLMKNRFSLNFAEIMRFVGTVFITTFELGNVICPRSIGDDTSPEGNNGISKILLKLFSSMEYSLVAVTGDNTGDAIICRKRLIERISRRLKHVLLSTMLVVIGWRQRRVLTRLSFTLVRSVMIPIKELLDSLGLNGM